MKHNTIRILVFVLALTLCVTALAGCGILKKPAATTEPSTIPPTKSTQPATHVVTFDLNGGTLVEGELKAIVPDHGQATAPKAEKGNMALSWDTDFSNVTSDLTVTAVWTKVAMDTVDLAEYVQQRTITVNCDNGVGSGFFIDDHGTVVTNYHVIEGANSISIDFAGGASYALDTIVDFSKVYDLAILHFNVNDTPYLELCTEVRTGEPVYAVGSSLGVLTGSFTTGTVSSTNRMNGLIECIQTDASIASGNSGGPLVNAYGEVVGINAFSYTRGQNANLSIKVSMLDKLTENRNYNIASYREWYNKETSRSYSPFDSDFDYYYSTINTYTTITDEVCVYSYTDEGEYVSGYRDMCMYYGYYYTASELDTYTEYLHSLGFEYDTDLSGENNYFYYSERDDVYIFCEILTEDRIVEVMPMKGDYLRSLLG